MVEENVLNINRRIADICSRINQDPGEITIVAVAKGRTVEQIKEVVEAGITDIGENRIQEAIVKYNELRAYELTSLRAIKWHMVGHLQTNKVKEAVKIFNLIQSVDSVRLAVEVDKQAARIDKIQDILIQVNTSGESAKFGLKSDGVIEVVKEIAGFKNINIIGLMTIAPLVANPEDARPCFRKLRELLNNLNSILNPSTTLRIDGERSRTINPSTTLRIDGERSRTINPQYSILSMGMTDDFEVAIEEGSTMVRLGRVIFGA